MVGVIMSDGDESPNLIITCGGYVWVVEKGFVPDPEQVRSFNSGVGSVTSWEFELVGCYVDVALGSCWWVTCSGT